MSAYVTGWVLKHSPVTGAARLVLIVLGDRADHEGRNAYPSVGSIANEARCTQSTVHRVLRELERDGHITREGVTHLRTTNYRVVMDRPSQNRTPPRIGPSDPDVGPSDPDVGPSDPGSADPPRIGPEPSLEPSKEPSDSKKRAREEQKASPPPDFPDELKPHARAVMQILVAIAETHGADRVWPLALGKTLMQFRDRPLVATAHELDHWAVDPPRPIKDVLRTYRTFLARARTLQGVERLGPSQSAGRSATVGRTTGRVSRYDHVIESAT